MKAEVNEQSKLSIPKITVSIHVARFLTPTTVLNLAKKLVFNTILCLNIEHHITNTISIIDYYKNSILNGGLVKYKNKSF